MRRSTAHAGRPQFEEWSLVGFPLSGLVDTWSQGALSDAHLWMWGLHVVAFELLPR